MIKNKIQKLLDKKGVIILDGAMATELEKRGCDLNNELWSATVLKEKPELIQAVHYDYFKAGADCGISASYQATIEGFMKTGLTKGEAEELIKDSVTVMDQARNQYLAEIEGQKPLIIAGSCGPYGAFLADGSEYRGNYDIGKEQLKDFHRRRMELLGQAGADVLAIETVPCLIEAQAAVEVASELGAFCWVSFSCKNDSQISDGTPLEECAAWLKDQNEVVAVGINCTAPEYVSSLIGKVIKGSEGTKPVIVYPNSGETYDPVKKVWNGAADGKTYGDRAAEWFEAGARIIGGCCQTSPEDIRQAAERLNQG